MTPASDEKKHLLFVYGTLMQGFGNHKYLLNRDPVYPTAYVKGRLSSLGGSYPGLLDEIAYNQYVKGEVYEISDADLVRLDRLEGYDASCHGHVDNLYNRVIKDCYLQPDATYDNRIGPVFVYKFNNPRDRDYPIIPSGSWREHLGFYKTALEAKSDG